MAELGKTFEHDCGMDTASWRVRVKNDFGEEAVEPFEKFVEHFSDALLRAEQSIDPNTNTDLLFHQVFPDIFPDPMGTRKRKRKNNSSKY